MRIFLLIAGCLLALAPMVAAAGYWWWQRHGDALIGAAGDGLRDGTAQGKDGTARECFDTGLAAIETCEGFDCSVYNRARATACFTSTGKDGGLCLTIPRSPGIVESLQWIAARCAQTPAEPSACQGLMQLTLDYCARDSG